MPAATVLYSDHISQLMSFFTNNSDLVSSARNEYDLFETGELFHYTSIATLFSMLESDSFWLTRSRFSNDSSEERLLGNSWLETHNYKGDNFIFCAAEDKVTIDPRARGDILSQWRAYCQNGGVSIGLDIAKLRTYTVMAADSKKPENNKIVAAAAFPVIYTPFYTPSENGALDLMKEIENKISKGAMSLNETDFVPYIKDWTFHEEQERRLLFSNTNGELSECIQFRQLQNGARLPYIVVKCGDIDESEKPYDTSKETISDIRNSNTSSIREVFIPMCSNQDELCRLVREYIENESGSSDKPKISVRVFCEGHLPIRSIRIAPMPDQNRIKELVSRFCESKYWLKDVEIRTSEIPYVPSLNS